LDGQSPQGVLLLNGAGNLYGTTREGGGSGCEFNFGCGTAFQLAGENGAWTETILHRFGAGKDGQQPEAGLISDAAKRLLGTTVSGGRDGLGTVFEVVKE
jgi:hypothetical protein